MLTGKNGMQMDVDVLPLCHRRRALLLPDCAPQLAHHVERTLLNRAVLVDSDVDRGDGLVFHIGLHVCDQVLRAELRRWNRAGFAMHP